MIRKNLLLIYISLLLIGLLEVSTLAAQQPKSQSGLRTKGFECPVQLRPRVNFWIDVFTKYGKYHVVMHHRSFPQAIYSVMDLTREGETLSPVPFEKYKKKAIQLELASIRAALTSLSRGATPRTAIEIGVRNALALIPGSSSAKYKQALEKDMIRAQTGIKEKYSEALQRSGRYMHLIVQTFVLDYGLPVELTRLPFIESSFDYTAYSSVGAAGIWQFMPRTAKSYGMQVGRIIDERRDVIEATKGAAKYLTFAYDQLGNWPLALTSYNHGIGGVRSKVKKFGTSSIVQLIENPSKQAFGFASSNFWPEFLAALEVYDNYQRYFPGLVLDSARYYTTYTMPHSMSPAYVSKKLGIPVETLRDYNYALSPHVWKGRYSIPRGYDLRIPKNVGTQLAVLRAPEPKSQASSIYGGLTYKVRSGDTLTHLAKRYGVSVSRIKALNNLKSDDVYVGQMLVIKESEARHVLTPKTPPVLAKTILSDKEDLSTATYTVRSGDSLYKIANKFNMSLLTLKTLNKMKSSKIHPGQKLFVTGVATSTKKVSSSKSVKTSGTLYKVGRGDTLWEISKKFGISISALKSKNKLKRNSLYVGQTLNIP